MATLQVGFHVDGDVWELEQIARVEEHGFNIMTTGEHIVFFRPILDTVTVLAYAAAVTKNVGYRGRASSGRPSLRLSCPGPALWASCRMSR